MTQGRNSCSHQCLPASSAASFPRNKVRFLREDLKIDAPTFLIWISEAINRSCHATQGPLPNTCGSFWQMVWEQRSRGVVMLNRVIEKGSVSGREPSAGTSRLPRRGQTLSPVCSPPRRSNVPSTGLSGRTGTASSRTQTSSSRSSRKTLNPTTRSVSWSWRTWPWVLQWRCVFVNVCVTQREERALAVLFQ